jgi:hypothetical protein
MALIRAPLFLKQAHGRPSDQKKGYRDKVFSPLRITHNRNARKDRSVKCLMEAFGVTRSELFWAGVRLGIFPKKKERLTYYKREHIAQLIEEVDRELSRKSGWHYG